ncbi:MAG: hypothetical protein ACI9VR_005271 [Cognaticolwellia sp.]|jgi:hypothetical protein
MLTLLLSPLLACAPADLADPFFQVETVTEYAVLAGLASARILPDDPDPIGESSALIMEPKVPALDWNSDQVQVGWSSGGVLWTVWLDREDLVSAVPKASWVEVGDQGAGVRFPAGLRLDAQQESNEVWVSHPEGLEPIPVPWNTVDQVFDAEVRLRDGLYSGFGRELSLVDGALLLDGVDGQSFAWFEGGVNDWVSPIEREGDGWWVSWDAHFGTVEAWVHDSDLVEQDMAAGGWGGSHCGGITVGGMGYWGFGSEPTLPQGTLLLDAPGGTPFARVERDRWDPLGEPVQAFYPLWIQTPWGEQELWAYLD